MKYKFTTKDGELEKIGEGSFSVVYAACRRKSGKGRYAVKVIGFGNNHIDRNDFRDIVVAQENLSYAENIVRVYDGVQLRVWIEGRNTVQSVAVIDTFGDRPVDEGNGDYLDLQFVVTERLEPVLREKGPGYVKLYPQQLQDGDEPEIEQLAHDIGVALYEAHKRKILHRDIKLENIFYSPEDKIYKLGDFGISKVTSDGFASTRAFSHGYGAPEVVSNKDDRYDATSDIYSLGMVIYVLLNGMCFPDSGNYCPNVIQYTPGYVPPSPVNASEEMTIITDKMLRFDPDERYQSVEEMLDDLEVIDSGLTAKYVRERGKSSRVFAILFAVCALFVTKMIKWPDLGFDLTGWEILFLGMCVSKAILREADRDIWPINLGIIGVGVYMLIGDFSWLRLLILGTSALLVLPTGVLGGAILSAWIFCRISDMVLPLMTDPQEIKWIGTALWIMCAYSLLEHSTIPYREMAITRQYIEKNKLWLASEVCFLGCVLVCFMQRGAKNDFLPKTIKVIMDRFAQPQTFKMFILCAVLNTIYGGRIYFKMLKDRIMRLF